MPMSVSSNLGQFWAVTRREIEFFLGTNVFNESKDSLKTALTRLDESCFSFLCEGFDRNEAGQYLKVLRNDFPVLITELLHHNFSFLLLDCHTRFEKDIGAVEASSKIEIPLWLPFTQLCGSLFSCSEILKLHPESTHHFSFCTSDLTFCLGSVTSASAIIIHQDVTDVDLRSVLADVRDLSDVIHLMGRVLTVQENVHQVMLEVSKIVIGSIRRPH
jgi:hypothetical protein